MANPGRGSRRPISTCLPMGMFRWSRSAVSRSTRTRTASVLTVTIYRADRNRFVINDGNVPQSALG